ncbi:MAG: hypothetical protein Q7W51_11225 [Coriobacteriia bacterium]|nr:hypothetical protein [Coriobacteriia bacterium]
MSRRRHHNQHVEIALRYAEARGWRVEPAGARSHAWGRMLCPHPCEKCREGEFCMVSVWSTPRSPETHAQQLRRVVDGCMNQKRGYER